MNIEVIRIKMIPIRIVSLLEHLFRIYIFNIRRDIMAAIYHKVPFQGVEFQNIINNKFLRLIVIESNPFFCYIKSTI